MSASLLREAAALMRERAEAVRKAHHAADPSKHGGPDATYSWVFLAGAFAKHAPGDANDPELKAIWEADAQHLDPWQHRDVTLAVADWLDAEAEAHEGEFWTDTPPDRCCRMPEAFAVACAYLGRDA